ncbi:DUF3290 family protein [Secundilactobacillus yichangensis]|uniref:DUF3290 family protein n=1 Tax=Secundilactobacillus yichangensis TaxID=2799580 RepID=UPI001940A7DE|nr:DUF3290 family protein [Secundilactobacillus yichangensis]
MTFYTYSYLKNQNFTTSYIRLAILTILLIAAVVVFLKYFRDRTSVKYRDLLVIFLTASLLLISFQFQNFSILQNNKHNSSNVLGILSRIAKQNHVSPRDLQTNTTTASDQMLVRDSQHHLYYRVLYNDDQSGFMTEKINVQLTKTKLKVVGGY